jgi:hypothetical protein
MAYYAFLDKNNIVTEVITGVDETELIEGLDTETWYGNFRGQTCKRTSYNAKIRANFAGIGYKYDEEFNVFIPPQPYPSWKLNYTTYGWEAPINRPEDTEGHRWAWSESNQEWISVPIN